ncbi:hypothetical protein [Xanthomonas albilineans]|uniref:hypothetical protein n=1 Tax=Xanthomonas albilineans TaxID=29447 RepID=UPI000AC5C7FE|nr:hypothetical protein [Xanthomonas albilineans]
MNAPITSKAKWFLHIFCLFLEQAINATQSPHALPPPWLQEAGFGWFWLLRRPST